MKSLNQLQRQQRMDQTQDRRKRVDMRKKEITTKELIIQEVLEKIIDITHLAQQGNFMHLKIP
jgi:hypothetical protein